MLPFTRDQFFDVFAAYNAATWPASIAAYPMAVAAVVVAWRGTASSGRMVALILALMWGWVGVAYHGLYFSQINPIARVFAGAFVAQALLFTTHAALRTGFEFGPRSPLRAIAGGAMILYAMVVYPVIGLAVGDGYPALPLFGVAPCPLLVFTFGLMLWATRARWWLWLIPLLWSAAGGSAFVVLSVPQDWALPVSAFVALLIVWVDARRSLASG